MDNKRAKDSDELRAIVSGRIKHVRNEGLQVSQQQLSDDATYLEGANLQVKIAGLEKGKGSMATIFAILQHFYDRGINLNYLFGDPVMYRGPAEATLYPENIQDYLKNVQTTAARAQGLLSVLLQDTERVEEYIEETLQLARERKDDDAPPEK